MSIIRQRWKNLIISGVIGFMSALIIVMLCYLFLIRGNEEAINLVLMDSQFQVTAIAEKEKLIKKKVYTLSETGDKGEIITRDMIQALEVDINIIPDKVVLNIDELLNKKLTIDISPLTMLTEAMVTKVELFEVKQEVIEISGIRIPEILAIGDLVNLRIHYPTGQDYTVIKNKEVLHINIEANTFFIALGQEEILSYSSAREDGNLYAGTKMYITQQESIELDLKDEISAVKAISDNREYSRYPLNPNAQSLSLIYQTDTKVLNSRKILDESLEEFFDQEGFLYNYELIATELVDGETTDSSKLLGEEDDQVSMGEDNTNEAEDNNGSDYNDLEEENTDKENDTEEENVEENDTEEKNAEEENNTEEDSEFDF